MKKVAAFLALLLIGGVGLLLGLSQGGFALGGLEFAWDGERAHLARAARSFLEDIQYKDFARAASYHTHQDQKKVDIPLLIERLFRVKPEQLNIRNIEITEVTIDSSGDRARTFFTATTELLNSAKEKDQPNKERKVEGILYWHRRPASEADPPAAEEEPASGDAASSEPEDQSARRFVNVGEGTPYAEETTGQDQRWFMMLESSLH